jgi:hypothetical protein
MTSAPFRQRLVDPGPVPGARRVQLLYGWADLARQGFRQTAEFLWRQHDCHVAPRRCTRTGSACAMSISSPKRFLAPVAVRIFMEERSAELTDLGKVAVAYWIRAALFAQYPGAPL